MTKRQKGFWVQQLNWFKMAVFMMFSNIEDVLIYPSQVFSSETNPILFIYIYIYSKMFTGGM